MDNSPRRRTGLVLAILAVLGLTAGTGAGLVLGWVVWPVSYVNTTMADLQPADKEKYAVLVAAAYAGDGDLDRARARLDRLGVPNVAQWIGGLTERAIGEGRNDTDIRFLAELAEALGASTVQMAAFLGTPTADIPALPFDLVEARLLTIDENLGCAGKHSLWVQVRDAAGAPLDGVFVCAYRAIQAGEAAACQPSGSGPASGWVEFPTYRTGEQVYVAADAAGQTHLSSLTQAFSDREADIPPAWLVGAGYCQDAADCAARSAENALCQGRYSYQAIFQRAW